MNRLLIWPTVIGAVLMAACSPAVSRQQPPPVECPAPPAVEELVDGWRFVADPTDSGIAGGWFNSAFDRSKWAEQPIGRAWEQNGLEYDGVAWYAREVAWEGDEAYLFVADADDSATIWVDGEEVAVLGPDEVSTVLTLDDPSGRAHVAIRVSDVGGYGGIKTPPRLSATADGALDQKRLIQAFEARSPGLPPAPAGTAWTMIGGIDEADETLIAADGSLSPWAGAPSTQVWLRNEATGETVNAFAGGEFALLEGAPSIRLSAGPATGMALTSTSFYDESDRAVRWQVTAERDSDAFYDQLIVAARPFRVNRTLAPFCNPVYSRASGMWLNNEPYLAARTVPDDFVTAETWAGLIYPLQPGQNSFEFALPASAGRDLPATRIDLAARLEATLAAWSQRQQAAQIIVPDKAVQAALDASLGYLLLASDPNGPHPGPLAHDAIWTRDAAYMGQALLMRGFPDNARNYVNSVFAGQDPSGRVPPIQGENIPWDNNEWDAQGQAIFLAMQIHSYTGNDDFLNDVYPNIARAADYIIELRRQTAGDPPPTRGLLPISLSAEDLADGEQHYYWDNYWAVVGLLQAAKAADHLGTRDGDRWRAEATALRAAIDASLEATMGNPVPYVPASVESRDNSGMARGTTPALHPYPIVAPDDALMNRAFQYYADRFVTPYGGGYLHREGQFWTYGGVDLANVYLRLNRGDLVHQILGWTLAHETLPGTLAWAEQVDPVNYTFSGGDMPHAWMASSLTILIRNMLVLEYGRGPEDDALTLFQTAPSWWFEDGREVILRELPTLYGPLDLATSGDLRNTDGRWVGSFTLSLRGASPPGGYRWALPFLPAGLSGDAGARVEDGVLLIPNPGDVTLLFD